MGKNWPMILIAIATVILGAVAIIAGVKLYPIGKEPLAPKVAGPTPVAATPTPIPKVTPETIPAPECTLSFNIAYAAVAPTSSPSPSPSPSPTPTPRVSPSPTATPVAELPEAGIVSPTIFVALGGIILWILGLLL